MKTFEHDGVTFDMDKPEIEGWEFNDIRYVANNQLFFNGWHIEQWIGTTSRNLYWIATRKPGKPVVDGWVFLGDEQRSPKKGESYYSDIGHRVLLAIVDFQCNKYWIATKVAPRGRKVVRHEIRKDCNGLYYVASISFAPSIHALVNYPNFIGFEFEDGTIDNSPILYQTEDGFSFYPPTVKDIVSGKVEVKHAKFALFFE